MSESRTHTRELVLPAWLPTRGVRRVAAVLLFAVATAVGARLAVPVPLSPVPVTLQTLFVLLAGALLGPRLGAASQLAYLGAGVAGLPVFAAGAGVAYLLGPTGGYLLAFPVAAFLAGMVTDRVRGPGIGRGLALFGALLLVSFVILLGGAAWLALATGDPAGALALGVLPFLLGDVLKVALATLLAHRGRDKALGLL
jgi:biotin transport system substrate-specific component